MFGLIKRATKFVRIKELRKTTIEIKAYSSISERSIKPNLGLEYYQVGIVRLFSRAGKIDKENEQGGTR